MHPHFLVQVTSPLVMALLQLINQEPIILLKSELIGTLVRQDPQGSASTLQYIGLTGRFLPCLAPRFNPLRDLLWGAKAPWFLAFQHPNDGCFNQDIVLSASSMEI